MKDVNFLLYFRDYDDVQGLYFEGDNHDVYKSESVQKSEQNLYLYKWHDVSHTIDHRESHVQQNSQGIPTHIRYRQRKTF